MADLDSGATVDRHAADQLIPFAALAAGKSAYRIPMSTEHIRARLWLIQEILGARAGIAQNMVRIEGIGHWKRAKT
jgi:RNA 3'-terminal phosphate cyclase (ATP)